MNNILIMSYIYTQETDKRVDNSQHHEEFQVKKEQKKEIKTHTITSGTIPRRWKKQKTNQNNANSTGLFSIYLLFFFFNKLPNFFSRGLLFFCCCCGLVGDIVALLVSSDDTVVVVPFAFSVLLSSLESTSS
jgi:hypothetical protein